VRGGEMKLSRMAILKSFMKPEVEREWENKFCKCLFKKLRYQLQRGVSEKYYLYYNNVHGEYVFFSTPEYIVFHCDRCRRRVLADVNNKYFSSDFLKKKFGQKVYFNPYYEKGER
jgi:hypothetical protein